MKAKGYNGNGCGTPLAMASVLWATPSRRDWKDTPGMATTAVNPDGTTRTRLDQLGRQAPRSGIGGPQSGQTSRLRLNPLFVEWLMGLPVGWTDSRPLATESYQQWRRTHGSR